MALSDVFLFLIKVQAIAKIKIMDFFGLKIVGISRNHSTISGEGLS